MLSEINESNPMLTEKDVAKLLGKSTAWLQRARYEGESIPYRKIGRSVRYLRCDVLTWIEKNSPVVTSTKQYEEK